MAERCHHVGCDDSEYDEEEGCEYEGTIIGLQSVLPWYPTDDPYMERFTSELIADILRCYRGRTDRDAPAA